MRGEHSSSAATIATAVGSSPHARGAPVNLVVLQLHQGIIPACAGSTPSCTDASRPRRDHPRMRGEHIVRHPVLSIVRGSSPHARGALANFCAESLASGIIPACAGSTLEYLRLCPGLKRITLTLPITSEADKRTEKHPNHQLMPRAFRPSRRHCRAGCGPIHCLTPRTSWPSCTCLPCSSPFSSCRQASRHPCPSAS